MPSYDPRETVGAGLSSKPTSFAYGPPDSSATNSAGDTVQAGWEVVSPGAKLLPNESYRATLRVNKRWSAWYEGAIRGGIKTYDFLNDKVTVTSVAFDTHPEISAAPFFDVLVTLRANVSPNVQEAGLSGAAVSALIVGALGIAILATGVLFKFEHSVSGAVNTLFSPGGLILIVVALFLILKLKG
jgi:hypothetical protein